jgi:hypothetical protein
MQSNHAWVLLVAGLGILHAVSPAPAVTAADDDPGLRAFLHDVEASERSAVRLVDTPATAPMTLRVTYVVRKEDGRWKLLHRHADPLVETTAPGAVVKP